MPWHKKDQRTPVEYRPIPGLSFLIGDLFARRFQQRGLDGRKYATVTFPSGLTREVQTAMEPNDTPSVLLLGGLQIPLTRIEDASHQALVATVRAQGFAALPLDANTLLIWRPEAGEHFRVRYSGTALLDIRRQEGEPGRATVARPMELLDAESRALLPPLYAGEKLGLKALAPMKFFTPDSGWTWYPTEFDGNDLFFGLVSGLDVELGYFSLGELEQVRGPLGLPIERDLDFTSQTLGALKRRHEGGDPR